MPRKQEEPIPKSIALAWALAGLLHLLTFRWALPLSWDGILYTAATFLLLAKPGKPLRQAAFLLSTILLIAWNYPAASNHIVLEFWIMLSLAGTFLVRRWVPNAQAAASASFFDTIAPLVRIQYLLAFAFAAFSKLNSDFLDPEWSCAALFAERSLEFLQLETLSFGILSPDHRIFASGAIFLALCLEIAIPCLLLSRRTRRPGICLALLFHFAMGFVPILGISSYSALSFTLLLFFFPKESLQSLEHKLDRIFKSLPFARKTTFLTPLLTASLLAIALFLQHRYFHPAATPIAFLVWLTIYLPFTLLAFQALKCGKGFTTEQANGPLPRPRFLAILALPVLMLGLLPYLGLQTQGSFTMFSNLRTLGPQPNHLLAAFFRPQRETILIKIHSTNHPNLDAYPESGLLLTSHEFARKTTGTKEDYFVLCEYEGKMELVGRFNGELTPHPILHELRFPTSWIRFRDVPEADRCPCTW